MIALIIQVILVLITKNFWIGAAAGSFYFIGREYAQAEYRNIEANYEGIRANMPWWGGLQPRAWTQKGLLDFITPTIVVVLIALRYS